MKRCTLSRSVQQHRSIARWKAYESWLGNVFAAFGGCEAKGGVAGACSQAHAVSRGVPAPRPGGDSATLPRTASASTQQARAFLCHEKLHVSESAVPPESLNRLYSDHHSWLRSWLARRLRCSETASDLAHDTYVRVMSRPTEIREPRAFLVTVARALLINFVRRRELEAAYLEALANLPEDVDAGPERQALVVETLVQMDSLLSDLPAKARTAFLMSQLEGLTYNEIAARLGVSSSMVKKYMLQAIKHCLRNESQR